MNIQILRFVTLVLAALSLTMTSAHVLELPQKMQYGATMYSAVNTTLYRYFAIVGGFYQIGSIVAAFALAFLLRRHRPAFRWTLAGAVFLLLSFASWLVIVAPANGQVAQALHGAADSVPTLWLQLRDRWEYGHATGFVLTLVGFSLLIVSALAEIPADRSRNRA